ncbi:MAG: tetratricopeptide repeat protein [Gemmataceae bacterium]|nr:tetratricopeptide repeat protein [Gemmataceae bacterium]
MARPAIRRFAALALAVAGGVVVTGCSPPRPGDLPAPAAGEPLPPDPREAFDTPFRNVRPGVRYVGDAACAGCHPSIDKTYHRHPMGRSAAAVGQAGPLERYDPETGNPFRVGDFELEVVRTPAGETHRQRCTAPAAAGVAAYAVRVEVAIGSGVRGRSYLSVDGGAVWQSPVSWYSGDGRWNVSPGFALGERERWPAGGDCLFCHVGRVEPVPGSLNRYAEPLLRDQPNVGCERCHGPGELHVAEQAAGGPPTIPDHSIVNPKHLPADLREDVCRQCHLGGLERVDRPGRTAFEYRPGLPLELFRSVFVLDPDRDARNASVGQFEQLEQSRCHAGSAGRLGCTSCHDPHAVPEPADRAAFYRGRCAACHPPAACTAPEPARAAAANDCTGCHMPKAASTNIAHASVTNHRIPRRPGPDGRPTAPRPPAGSPAGVPLVAYFRSSGRTTEADRERDLGVALAAGVYARRERGLGPAAVRAAAEQAIGRLRAAVERHPGDAGAWLGLARAYAGTGEDAARLEAAAAASRLEPEGEIVLAELAEAAAAAGDRDGAERAYDRLLGMNPTAVTHHVGRAGLLLDLGRWDRAAAAARAGLAVQPTHAQLRLYLAVALSRLGDPAAARREAEAGLALQPDAQLRDAYRQWYARRTR